MNIKKAALINAGGKYSKIFLSLVVNAILARILSAEDYGIVAVITVFSTFFTTFSDMGFGPAIIQNKELTKKDIDNIYSFTVYISLVLMVIFLVCSFPVAAFYGDKVYISLGWLLSVSLLFNALNMVPNGILNRNKKFISIAIRTVVVYAASAIITIVLAIFGFRYYALAIQAILTAFFTFVWNFATTRPHFIFKIEMNSIKKVLNYSGYQFAFNLVNYFSRNLDNLLTGKFMGSAELGYYNKAYTLMLYPVNNLTGVISPVLHPILSDYQKQIDVIYKKYMKIVRLLACIGLYVSPVCFLAANELITILYGSNWENSVVCFQLLAIAIVPQMINSSAGSIFQAIGNTKLLFVNSCINTGITIIAISIGVFYGKNIQTLSVCVAIAYLSHFITAFIMLIKMGFKYKISTFLRELLPEFFILIFMLIAVRLYPFNINAIFVSAIVKCIYLGIIYLIALFVSREYKLFVSMIKR
jgi:PST family polysaccharide transporter